MKKLEDGQYMSLRREDGFVREQNTHMTRFHPFERRKTLFEKRQPRTGRANNGGSQQKLSLGGAGPLQDFLGGRVWIPSMFLQGLTKRDDGFHLKGLGASGLGLGSVVVAATWHSRVNTWLWLLKYIYFVDYVDKEHELLIAIHDTNDL